LLDKAFHPAKDPARQAASRELDKLLLAIAEQSDPSDWTPEHEVLFHACRERNATRELAAVARTTRWAPSNQGVLTALLNALPTADPWAVPALVGVLPALEPTETDRAAVRTALLNALPTADPGTARALVAALLTLVATEADRAEVRTALLNALPTADPRAVRDLVAALRSVSPVQSWLAWLANLG
jgi:hypothetical protein